MQREPELSIIIPYYNGENYIGRLLESILNNNRFHESITIEVLLIVDSMNTNTDTLGASIQEFKDPLSITIYKNDRNLGVAGTRNAGIKYAKGEYLFFIDQDDEILPLFFLELVNNHFKQYDFILINGLLSYSDGFSCRIFYLRPQLNFKSLVTDDFIRSPGQVIIKKSLLNAGIAFPVPTKHYGSDDKFFYLTIFKLLDPHTLYINTPLYKANIHDANYSNDQHESVLSSLELFEQFRNQHLLSEKENHYFDNSIDMLLFRMGRLSGMKKIKGLLLFLSYKLKMNKCVRYFNKFIRL